MRSLGRIIWSLFFLIWSVSIFLERELYQQQFLEGVTRLEEFLGLSPISFSYVVFYVCLFLLFICSCSLVFGVKARWPAFFLSFAFLVVSCYKIPFEEGLLGWLPFCKDMAVVGGGFLLSERRASHG